MISIFTPTHNTRYLADAYQSLIDQVDAPDWEWVIVPNAGAIVPDSIASDVRVRIVGVPADMENAGIGALKRWACENCRGDWLLELDHDDLLAPTALRRVSEASGSGAGLIYSDFCEFRSDGSSHLYDAAHGWQAYGVQFRGRTYQAHRAFAPSAATLFHIASAPNHVRVWRADAYRQVGGHDPKLELVDDFDLIARTYLAGFEFHHIPECLYFYRLHDGGENTHVKHGQRLQTLRQQLSNTYVYRLIHEWCRRSELPMLDLGGGHNSPAGYLSVDLVNGDVTCDIRNGLPFEDGTVGCVRAYDFLEHIPQCRDSSCRHGDDGSPRCVVGVMNEIYRVLVPGGWFVSRTPSTDGRGAFQDPTHVSFWNPNSFWYYTRREHAKYVPGIRCRFQATRVWQAYPSDWYKQNNIPYVFADLIALKGQIQPGLQEI